jgi:two-component system LytT family response regulator
MKAKIKTVLIDDEYSNRELLIGMISGNENFEIVGQADGVENGLNLITEKSPDLVFLDIRMPDGNGFELLSRIEVVDFMVVFVSAFDTYALKAFDFNAVDYVLKPIDTNKFSHTLQKVIDMQKTKSIANHSIKEILQQYDLRNLIIQKVAVHSGNRVILLPLSEIVSAVANEGTTLFNTVNGQKYSSSKQISDFDFIFESYRPLVRISRGAYINTNFIESYSKGTICMVFMSDGSDFEVSRRKKTEILDLLSASSSRNKEV